MPACLPVCLYICLPAYTGSQAKTAVVVIQGVKELHDAGFYHMDLKPENLCMVAGAKVEDLHAYVVDLGSCVDPQDGKLSPIAFW